MRGGSRAIWAVGGALRIFPGCSRSSYAGGATPGCFASSMTPAPGLHPESSCETCAERILRKGIVSLQLRSNWTLAPAGWTWRI